MTKQEAAADFQDNVLPYLKYRDAVAKCEAWNDYTDFLCKDGKITQHQYDTWTNPF